MMTEDARIYKDDIEDDIIDDNNKNNNSCIDNSVQI